ncbi:ABC transporter ATP-binding protein [Alkalihalobacillus sp. AL-G]|uniref:ABC transporter ATP-binding protein n=1 Tax=Alkalihalobacillus sp. AL-G TaxID=2926399 RepID=UPI00272ADF4E|nr:ABC transporter ATP-binding protein [Alkalihalobacillus sp. AL-G]WLD93419.1 ABC transporter ATP-binding protein [Alkalihalobacillus sp. AL-G]
MSDTYAIELKNLSKTYGGSNAVNQLDLNIRKGELFGFLGPNGAGKTTTIKMMTGLLEPSTGSVKVNGIDIWEEPVEAKKKIAYLPDQPNLYPKLTGWEFLRFIGSVFKIPQNTFEKRAEEYLKLFGLYYRAGELIESYSHGMKQKIALCGALIHNPEVLFLDEPTVGLDPKSARSLKSLLRKLCDRGTTVFISTHILEIAERMCDRVGIIRNGDVIALGTMEELRQGEGKEQASLEDIFLELTGGEESRELISLLDEEQEEVQ